MVEEKTIEEVIQFSYWVLDITWNRNTVDEMKPQAMMVSSADIRTT